MRIETLEMKPVNAAKRAHAETGVTTSSRARHTRTMAESRAERRRKAKAGNRKRQEDIEKVLEEPRLPAFEPPPAGKVVEDPRRPKR